MSTAAEQVSSTYVEPNDVHVEFVVYECDDPQELTLSLGIAPTKAWKKGDPIPPNAEGRAISSRWVLTGGLAEKETVEKQMEALLPLLESRREAIDRIRSRYKAGLLIACYFYEVNPQWRFDEIIIQRIAKLGLPIRFDLYCLNEESATESDHEA